MSALAGKVVRCCRDLARMTEEKGRTTRTFLSPPMRDVHANLGRWMKDLGMEVHVDAAGNLRGLYGDSGEPRVLIGSHLDTVPDAGAFDGILGVVLGIALVETRPRVAVEVIGFSEEEGVRFGTPFIGSRALIGATDWDNPGINQAIREFGLDPRELPAARLAAQTIGYLEFHIEQGPILESLNLPLGLVEGIAGQSRYLVTFEGKANHAGTTPMALRQDALVAAAQWICEVERYARQHEGLVATVGSLCVSPNAGNVIPGEVRASLDVRHARDNPRRHAATHLLSRAAATHQQLLDQDAVDLDEDLTATLAVAVEAAGYPVHRMSSGAGHDAMVLAPHLPSAMLFLRSPGGISHHPDESVLEGDVDAALAVGAEFLRRIEVQHV
jgi:allantoate deiminase